MCFEFLAQLSRGEAPLTFSEPGEINNLMVLRAAGFVAAFTLHTTENGQAREWGRYLALTPAGRTALAQNAQEARDARRD